MIDVDRFGLYNTRYGHLPGDEVLRALGATLASAMRQTDCAYRYGGEEFLVLLAGVNEVEASHAAERIRAAVAARAIEHLDNEPGCVTISIGLVALPAGTWLDGNEAKKLADGALRAAKRDGRNRVCSASVGEPAAQSLSA